MDKVYNGRGIFGLGGEGKFLRIPEFPRLPRNRPGHIFNNTYFEEHLRTAASASVFNQNKRCLCGSKTLHKIDLKN